MRLSESITSYQEKVDELISNVEKINLEVQSLSNCKYSEEVFSDIMGKIQKAVDGLNLHSYSNLNAWVKSLDSEVEKKLVVRVMAGVYEWMKCLDESPALIEDLENAANRPGGYPQLKDIRVEVILLNSRIEIKPSLAEIRKYLTDQLNSYVAIACDLPKVQSQRYQVGLAREEAETITTYRKLAKHHPDGVFAMSKGYQAIEDLVYKVQVYSKRWIGLESLWNLEINHATKKFDTIPVWVAAVEQFKELKKIYETSETNKIFGPVKIDFASIKSQITLKHESFLKQLVSKFGQILGEGISDFFGSISKARTELESSSLEVASTSEAVNFITQVQNLKRLSKAWDESAATFREGQKVLDRNRYQFPNNWLYSDNVDGEYSAFSEILKRKDSQILMNMSTMQQRIQTEDQSIEERTHNMLADWERNKPIAGNLRPEAALNALAITEGQFMRLKDEREMIQKAKEALELCEPGTVPASEERMQVAIEELQDLKGVWAELNMIWEKIEVLKEQPWLSIQPRKVWVSM
jgi:dynein heavy chain 1